MKIILINVNDVILGPYSAEDIVKNLLEKRFLPIHEIAWPKKRWFRIDKHPQFADICKQISELNLAGENISDLTQSLTQSLTASLRAETHTNTKTNLLDTENTIAVLKEEIDQTQTISNLEPEEGTHVFFPLKGNKKNKKINLKPDLAHTNQAIKKLAHTNQAIKTKQNNLNIKAKKLKSNKMALIALGFFVLCLFGFLWQKKYFQAKIQKINLSLAQKLINKNQFYKSLNIYKKTLNIKASKALKLPIKVYENYALLLLLIDQDTFEVDKLTKTNLSRSLNKKRILALSLLFSEDNAKAQNILSNIINKKTQDVLNLASAYYKQGLYLKAVNTLKFLKNHKQALLLKVLSYIKLYQEKLDQKWLFKAENLLKTPLLSFYYKQKADLIKVYISTLLNKAPQKKDIALILNQDPYLENDIKTNLFTYSKIWSWEALNNYCQRIAQTKFQNLYFKALSAFCLSKAKIKTKNWNSLLQSLDNSKNILAGSVLAYIYKQEKLTDQYVVKLAYLTESLKAKNSFLLLSLDLRYCVQKQDKKCIKNRTADLLNIRPQTLFALFQRMQIYKTQGLNKEAKNIKLFLKNQAFDYHFL